MQYQSTRDKNLKAGSAQAVLNGLAPDGGLYTMPSFRVNPEKAMTAAKALPVSVQKIENILSTTDESLDEVFSLNGFKNL